VKYLDVQILAYSWYSQFWDLLCIGTTLANLNGLGNLACVSAGQPFFKIFALIWSDHVIYKLYRV